MSSHTTSRRALAAVLAALAAVLAPLPAVADVTTDPLVQQAQTELEAARQQHTAVEVALDEIAARYETVRAHAQLLEEELLDADARVDAVQSSVGEARSDFEDQVRDAYMRPGVGTARAVHAFLAGEDTPAALHQTAVMGQVTAAEAAQLDATEHAGALELDAVDQHQVVQAGAAASEADLAAAAAELEQALADASTTVDAAAEDLELAEADAIRRAEEAAEAARAAAMAADAAATQAAEAAATQAAGAAAEAAAAQAWAALPPAPVAGGMTCPLAQPNGFIDSWGFPRSGGRRHQGVDMFAAYGAPIYAVADGVVSRVGNGGLGGLSLHLVDGRGDRYYYAHLSAAYVTPGTPVQVGQVIGANGDSGNARGTSPHLHWQWHPGGGAPVNPYPLAAALCRG